MYVVKYLGSYSFVYFYVERFVSMCRCILFLMLRRRVVGGIQRGGDTASFMALASACDFWVLYLYFFAYPYESSFQYALAAIITNLVIHFNENPHF